MYILYNATLKRIINYNKQLNTQQQAIKAVHSLTQRKNCCILALNKNTMQVVAVRKSKNSTYKFARNYFKNNTVYYSNYTTNNIYAINLQTAEVYNIVNIALL